MTGRATGGLIALGLVALAACTQKVGDAPAAQAQPDESVASVTTGEPADDASPAPTADVDRPVATGGLPLGLLDTSDAPILDDPEVRTGTLDNGLTYYVRHNDQPGGKVSLRLAVRAGSADELGPETGVAHFLEHMLFNGTEKYPENELVAVLRRFGSEFGADVNAYTSYDETVYQLDVPNGRATVDAALDVLDQWLGHATLDPAQVLAERGVVLDEWRGSTQTVEGRLYALAEQHYLAGTRYDGRNPIGTDASIEAMTAEILKRFYDTWYRPDNVAVIVVGDTDIDRIESRIEEVFGGATARTESRPERSGRTFPRFSEPGFVLHADPDQATVDVEVTLPLPAPEGRGTAAMRAGILDEVAFSALLRRLERDIAGGTASFDEIYPGTNTLVIGLDAPALYAVTDIARAEATLQALLDEYTRAYRYGFGAEEVALAVESVRARFDDRLAAEHDVQDFEHADALVYRFLDGVPDPAVRTGYELAVAELDAITPEAVDARFAARWTNTVPQVIISVPEHLAADATSAARVLDLIAAAPDREISERDPVEAPPEVLMARPAPVEPIETEQLSDAGWELFEPVEYTFPNGVRVMLNPNDAAQGEVYLQATSPGGSASVADADVIDALFAADVVPFSGAGAHDRSELADAIAGADVELTASILPYTDEWWGRVGRDDAEALFQLLHLYMAQPRVDPGALRQTMSRYGPTIEDPTTDPSLAGTDALNAARYGDALRYAVLPTEAEFATLDADGIARVWRERFGNASDWVFAFSGDFDPDQFEELAAAYLGTLPGTGVVDAPGAVTPPPPPGVVRQHVTAGSGATASVELLFTTQADRLHPEDDALASMAMAVIQARLDEVVREQFGDSYSPYVEMWVDEDPDPQVLTYVYASGAPDRIDAIADIVVAEIADLASGGLSDAEFDVARAPVVERYSYVDNEQFLLHLRRAALHDYDIDDFVFQDPELPGIDRSDVVDYIAEHVPTDQYVAAIVTPR